MELVQTLLIASTAVASLDLLDKTVKVSFDNNRRIKLKSEITAETHFHVEWDLSGAHKTQLQIRA